jgi:hypothetical protein
MYIKYAGILGAAMLLPVQMTERLVKTEYLACNPERQFEHAERLRKAGDNVGLHSFTEGALLSGTCISLTLGMAVFVVAKGKAEGVIRIRPKGSLKIFYTSELAFE